MTPFVPGGPERFAHQKRGLKKILETGGVCALLFDPGLGKTATTLDYASILALKSPTGEARVLVVSPLAAVDTWVTQAVEYVSPGVNVWAEALGGTIQEKAEALASRGGNPFASNPDTGPRGAYVDARAHHHHQSLALETRPKIDPAYGPDSLRAPRLIIESINIDALASRRKVTKSKLMSDRVVEAIKRFRPDLVVVDEGHKIKSASSNASMLLSRLTDFVKHRMLLTGTVMPHSPLDIYAQWRFLDPYAFGHLQYDGTRSKATAGDFRNRYAVLGGYMGKEVKGFVNQEEMRTIMARNAVVARKEDSLDLPPTMDVTVPVHLSPKEIKAYEEMKTKLRAEIEEDAVAKVKNKLTMTLRLRQITSGYLRDDNGVTHDLGRSKANTIASIVNDNLAGEKRVVVFANFTHEIDMIIEQIEKTCQGNPTEVMRIDGGVASEDRIKMRKRFGSSTKDVPDRIVLVAQIKTMSLAVNELVTASHCVFGSLSRQRDDLVQGRDRLNRLGQTRPVTFWYAIAPGTVDQVILDSHDHKGNLEAAMLQHIYEGTSVAA